MNANGFQCRDFFINERNQNILFISFPLAQNRNATPIDSKRPNQRAKHHTCTHTAQSVRNKRQKQNKTKHKCLCISEWRRRRRRRRSKFQYENAHRHPCGGPLRNERTDENYACVCVWWLRSLYGVYWLGDIGVLCITYNADRQFNTQCVRGIDAHWYVSRYQYIHIHTCNRFTPHVY